VKNWQFLLLFATLLLILHDTTKLVYPESVWSPVVLLFGSIIVLVISVRAMLRDD